MLNFRTTYVSSKGEVISDWKLIALNYLRGWFVVDFLAAIPFDHLYASNLLSGEVIFLFFACVSKYHLHFQTQTDKVTKE